MTTLPRERLAAKSILLVEDDVEIRTTLAEVLAEEGYQVLEAANGREGLECLRTVPPPSLIILDLMMPVMNGVEFRRVQAVDPRTAHVPVLVMSADSNVRALAQQLHASCIRKPLSLGELLKVVDETCREGGNP